MYLQNIAGSGEDYVYYFMYLGRQGPMLGFSERECRFNQGRLKKLQENGVIQDRG